MELCSVSLKFSGRKKHQLLSMWALADQGWSLMQWTKLGCFASHVRDSYSVVLCFNGKHLFRD
jgi:hypothetical protein